MRKGDLVECVRGTDDFGHGRGKLTKGRQYKLTGVEGNMVYVTTDDGRNRMSSASRFVAVAQPEAVAPAANTKVDSAVNALFEAYKRRYQRNNGGRRADTFESGKLYAAGEALAWLGYAVKEKATHKTELVLVKVA
jgi:hypothetical protein